MKRFFENGSSLLFGHVLICLLVAVLSFTVGAKYFTNPESYQETITSLDEKREAVLEMSAVAVASSAAITLLPDDTGTPIAEKLMDLSGYFLIVLSAIILEKYLLTVLGFVGFKILIPVGMIILALNIFLGNRILRSLSAKLALFGLCMALVIPASETVSNIIDSTYQNSSNITVEKVEVEEEQEVVEESKGFFDDVYRKITNWGKEIKEGAEKTIHEYEAQFNTMIEALAIMIVTNCVIPILVIVFFVWLIKMILGIDIDLPRRPFSLRGSHE